MHWIGPALVVLLCLMAHASLAAPLLVISIDGLHPSYVTEADRHKLAVPHLRRFVVEGVSAQGVIGVLPTMTYPSHTTMLTGVSPTRHGITSNTPFDPLGVNRDGWYWYAEDIRVPTLWGAAASAGLTTASVNWPVSVGDKYIQYLLPEYWRTSMSDDVKLLRALSRPEGLQAKLEQELGPFIDGGTDTLASDEVRTRFALAIMRDHKPAFMAVHLVALDGSEHANGPFVAPVYETLEAIDGMVGRLVSAARANDPSAVVAVVSDHGFIATHTAVNLRIPFIEAGLIQVEQRSNEAPKVTRWEAQLWSGAATAGVVLRDPNNDAVRIQVAAILDRLQSASGSGIARILDKQQLATTGGFPQADFLVEFAPGFYLGNALRGDLRVPATSKGTHGYMPDRAEMHASFFIAGEGIARGRNLGMIDMRQIAPTLADLLSLQLPTAQGAKLTVRSVPPSAAHQ